MTYPPPPPAEQSGQMSTTSEDRTWAMAAHLGALVTAWFALGLLAPLAVLLVQGNRSEFVRRHATESLNFQISLLIYSLVGTVLAFVIAVLTLGLGLFVIVPVIIVIVILALILVIVAGVAANRGDEYRYPLNIRIIR
ncbi:MAG: DUF4870 domain-containing protein [Actinomycetota bacterium]|nr:DUF4870 domain-containing protein [Actinomycetota bacterium]